MTGCVSVCVCVCVVKEQSVDSVNNQQLEDVSSDGKFDLSRVVLIF